MKIDKNTTAEILKNATISNHHYEMREKYLQKNTEIFSKEMEKHWNFKETEETEETEKLDKPERVFKKDLSEISSDNILYGKTILPCNRFNKNTIKVADNCGKLHLVIDSDNPIDSIKELDNLIQFLQESRNKVVKNCKRQIENYVKDITDPEDSRRIKADKRLKELRDLK